MDEPTMKAVMIKTSGPIGKTRVFDGEGAEIKNITKIVVTLEPGDIVRAELSVLVSDVEVNASAILSLESTKDAAAAHGYDLVKRA